MANLLDFVAIDAIAVSDDGPVAKIAEMHAHYDAMQSAANVLIPKDNRERVKVLEAAAKTVNDTTTVLRKQAFMQNLAMPTEIDVMKKIEVQTSYYDDDVSSKRSLIYDEFTRLNCLPRTTTAKLMKLADTFSMCIIPFRFLDERAYTSEDYSVRNEIKSFDRFASAADLQTYVVCPIKYYSVEKHASAENPDGMVYGGADLGMVLASVSMNIPMFRTILNQIADVKSDMKTLRTQISTQMQGMQKQVETLQAQVENIQRRLVEQEARQRVMEAKIEEQKAQNEALEARLREMSFSVLDPIMFAVKDFVAFGDQPAIIGPCWGPDFDAMIAEAHKMKVVRGQRKKLEAAITKAITGTTYSTKTKSF